MSIGLDLLELVWEIEEAFEVRFGDDDYQHCATVGELPRSRK
jgi:acyl carrier protein